MSDARAIMRRNRLSVIQVCERSSRVVDISPIPTPYSETEQDEGLLCRTLSRCRFQFPRLEARAFAGGHSPARMVAGAGAATLVVAYTAGGKDRGRARSGERASSSGGRGRARGRGGRGRTGSENGEDGSRPASERSRFRGAWLDPAARNTGAAPRMSSKTTKALIKAHGEEEYQFYVTFHVDRYMRLGRELGRWRRDFVTLRGREPQYEDMPQRIRNMEQTMLHIGFKLSNLE